jgi:ankyrin repeat protein
MHDDEEMVELLLSKSAEPNARDRGGHTPLHCAVIFHQKNAAKLLLNEGAGINIRGRDGKTPLGLALEADDKEMADFLRQHGGKE